MKLKSILLTAFLAAGLIGMSFAGPYDDWPDDAVCMWLDMKPTHEGYLAEADKRGITCQGGKAVAGGAKTTFTQSTTTNNKKTSSKKTSLSKDSAITIYDVVFTSEVLKELLERVVSKTDYDFNKHKLANNLENWRCSFQMKRVEYDNSVEGIIQNWHMAKGIINIRGSDVEFAKGSYWTMGGLSTDPSYLQDEVNIKLTEDGHIVGRMAYFHLGVEEGEVPINPMYVTLKKHKKSKPIDVKSIQKTKADLWIDVVDWSGGILRVNNCKQTTSTQKSTKTVVTAVVSTSDDDPTVSKVIEVIQGDRFIVDIAEPHELAGNNINLILRDIDAPDAIRSCPKQMELGTKVKDIVAQKLADATSIKLKNIRKTSKAVIAQVIIDGKDLGEELIAKGYASNEYGYWKAYICSSLTAYQSADQYMFSDNFEKAIFWYKRALEMDPDSSASSRSTYNLSNAYKNSGDVVIGLEYLKKAAILGWSEAELELGENYLFGWDGIVKDLSEAKYWLKKAYSHGQKKAEKIYCDSLTSDQQSSCKF